MENGALRPEDDPAYGDDLCNLATYLAAGDTVYVVLEARGTSYRLVIADSDCIEPLGEDPRGLGGTSYMFVAVETKGAYWFRRDIALDSAGYVRQKLGLLTDVCGEVIGGFLNDLENATAS